MLKNAAIAALLLGACLQAAAQPQPASDYNRGVDAYRAKDYAAARLHWQKAVEQGDVDAHNNLGYLLYNGLGGDQDPARAVSLWQQASMKGQRESQWHLGYAYETGEGVARDVAAAYVWFRCADASFRTIPPSDDGEADMAKDLTASIARTLARIPEVRRKQADDLAERYIDSFSAGRTRN
jgi:hypothetical protein